MGSYEDFLSKKRRVWSGVGVEANALPSQLFDWQAAIVRWATRKGRAALFADTGLGKSFMQVSWARAINKRSRTLPLRTWQSCGFATRKVLLSAVEKTVDNAG